MLGLVRALRDADPLAQLNPDIKKEATSLAYELRMASVRTIESVQGWRLARRLREQIRRQEGGDEAAFDGSSPVRRPAGEILASPPGSLSPAVTGLISPGTSLPVATKSPGSGAESELKSPAAH